MLTYARRTSRAASQTKVWIFESEDMCTEAWRCQCEQQRPQQARYSSARHIGMSRPRQLRPRSKRFKCAHTPRHAACARTAAATTRCGGRARVLHAWRRGAPFLALLITVKPSSYPHASMYQHTSAYLSIPQHTSFLALFTVNPSSYPHTSMYQHTSAYVSIRPFWLCLQSTPPLIRMLACMCPQTSVCVSSYW